MKKGKAGIADTTKWRKTSSGSVSPLCQRVPPFKTLHALCTSGVCQRVTVNPIFDMKYKNIKESKD